MTDDIDDLIEPPKKTTRELIEDECSEEEILRMMRILKRRAETEKGSAATQAAIQYFKMVDRYAAPTKTVQKVSFSCERKDDPDDRTGS